MNNFSESSDSTNTNSMYAKKVLDTFILWLRQDQRNEMNLNFELDEQTVACLKARVDSYLEQSLELTTITEVTESGDAEVWSGTECVYVCLCVHV